MCQSGFWIPHHRNQEWAVQCELSGRILSRPQISRTPDTNHDHMGRIPAQSKQSQGLIRVAATTAGQEHYWYHHFRARTHSLPTELTIKVLTPWRHLFKAKSQPKHPVVLAKAKGPSRASLEARMLSSHFRAHLPLK